MKFWEAVKAMMEDGRVFTGKSETIHYRIKNDQPEYRHVGESLWMQWDISDHDIRSLGWQPFEEPKPVRRVNLGAHWLEQLSGGAYVLVNNDGTKMQSYPLKFDPSTNECYVEISE